jgi:sulfur dioxygenase
MNPILQQLNPHSCRTYLLGRTGSREIVLIDPVLEHLDDYRSLMRERNLNLTYVIDTHTHADHISGAAALKDVTGCDYVMHEHAPAHCVTFRVHDGFAWELLDGIAVKVLHTPGHTSDSICLMLDGILFSGDTLFLDDGGAGRDDLPGGDPGLHWESLRRLSGFPGELLVHPAHEYRNHTPSSLERQKRTNPCFGHRSSRDFVRYLEDLRLGPADWMKDVLRANYACAQDPRAAWIPVDAHACEVKGSLEPGVNEMPVGALPASVLKRKILSRDGPVLIDVREKEELDGELGYIEGIVHVPIGSLIRRLRELEDYRDNEIVTVCRSGARAYTAAQILKKSGFKSVSVLSGGMIAWRNTK